MVILLTQEDVDAIAGVRPVLGDPSLPQCQAWVETQSGDEGWRCTARARHTRPAGAGRHWDVCKPHLTTKRFVSREQPWASDTAFVRR